MLKIRHCVKLDTSKNQTSPHFKNQATPHQNSTTKITHCTDYSRLLAGAGCRSSGHYPMIYPSKHITQTLCYLGVYFHFGCLCDFQGCFWGTFLFPTKTAIRLYISRCYAEFWIFKTVQKIYFYPLYFRDLVHKNKDHVGNLGNFFQKSNSSPSLIYQGVTLNFMGNYSLL